MTVACSYYFIKKYEVTQQIFCVIFLYSDGFTLIFCPMHALGKKPKMMDIQGLTEKPSLKAFKASFNTSQ